MLARKKILLGVTGSIAAYKSALLTRLLIKEQAEVKVILTASAAQFITPLTLATLSRHPVFTEFANTQTGEWSNHVELGLWADAFVVAPASAHTIAKCASGVCDNLLVAAYLSAKCPVFFAPAMDLDMHRHSSTQRNLSLLTSYGNQIIQSEYGELASGLVGEGRMAEPEHIVAALSQYFANSQQLRGKKIMVTAGPTYEALDPVRFIGNHSSGKMGYAIAEYAAECGAEVQLISGPSNLQISHPNVQLTRVTSAQEMYERASQYFPQTDVAILAAAVADYTPKVKASQKIKKQGNQLKIELIKTVDIAAALGERKSGTQRTIGFALETERELEHAKEKLRRKNFDWIVLNSLNDTGAGFGHDTNKVTIIAQDGTVTPLELKSKSAIARDIVNLISRQL